MFYNRTFNTSQFDELKSHFKKARERLDKLAEQHPEHENIWDIVNKKMEIIQKTIGNDEIPSDDQKRDADLSTMLNHSLRDNFPGDELAPLFALDKAYTLLGIKDIGFKLNNSRK